MSPTCSKSDLAGRNALSAADLTICSPPEPVPCWRPRPRTPTAGDNRRRMNAEEDYVMEPRFATHNRDCPKCPAKAPELTIRRRDGGGRVRGMLPAALEESASTARSLKARKRDRDRVVSAAPGRGRRRLRRRAARTRTSPPATSRCRSSSADFPSKQQLAQNTNLTLAVAQHRRQDDPRPRDHDLHDLERQTRAPTRPRARRRPPTGSTGTAQDLPHGPGLLLGPLRAAGTRDPLPAGLDPRERLTRSSQGQTASAGAGGRPDRHLQLRRAGPESEPSRWSGT